jgi:hypothetical protein
VILRAHAGSASSGAAKVASSSTDSPADTRICVKASLKTGLTSPASPTCTVAPSIFSALTRSSAPCPRFCTVTLRVFSTPMATLPKSKSPEGAVTVTPPWS